MRALRFDLSKNQTLTFFCLNWRGNVRVGGENILSKIRYQMSIANVTALSVFFTKIKKLCLSFFIVLNPHTTFQIFFNWRWKAWWAIFSSLSPHLYLGDFWAREAKEKYIFDLILFTFDWWYVCKRTKLLLFLPVRGNPIKDLVVLNPLTVHCYNLNCHII